MSETPPLPIRILPHLFLLVAITVELLLASGFHQEQPELHTQAAEGSSHERIWALHVLANRDPANAGLDPTYVQALLRDEDPLVVDFAFTIDICRLVHPAWQNRRMAKRLDPEAATTSPDEPNDWWRRFVLFRRKVGGMPVGGTRRLRLEELRWYLDALQGIPVDEQFLIDSANERQMRALEDNTLRTGSGAEDRQPGLVPGRGGSEDR